jgi:hypothetical protein
MIFLYPFTLLLKVPMGGILGGIHTRLVTTLHRTRLFTSKLKATAVKRHFWILAALISLPAFSWTTQAQPTNAKRSLTSHIPARDHLAVPGSKFMHQIRTLSGDLREQAIVNQITDGNIPSLLRNLKPITVSSSNPHSSIESVTFWVMPDYLAIGSDDDYVRVPMNLLSAERISRSFSFRLPTKKMVDLIYENASIKLRPRPMRPGQQMTTTPYFQRHDRIINQQLGRYSFQPSQLVAGHKKDVVQTNRLRIKPGAIAIYGWHRSQNKPIQPLSTVHVAEYADYSHGIRLVANQVEIRYRDNHVTRTSLDALLKSDSLCHWLSDEGPIKPIDRVRSKDNKSVASRSI